MQPRESRKVRGDIEMFTGIVEELGSIRSSRTQGDGRRMQINATDIVGDISIGDSISVNGCCLTVIAYENKDP